MTTPQQSEIEAERARIRDNIAWAYAHGEITHEQAADALAALEDEWSNDGN